MRGKESKKTKFWNPYFLLVAQGTMTNKGFGNIQIIP
jgi:hypothetical protein